MSKLIETIKSARRVSTPLLAVNTPDQHGLVMTLAESINSGTPIVSWDIIEGYEPVNEEGKEALRILGNEEEIKQESQNTPVEALRMAVNLPEGTIVMHFNSQRYFQDPLVIQGVMNLRDKFKTDQRQLVMMSTTFSLPSELKADVVTLEDPYPNDEELGRVVSSLEAATADTVEGFALKSGEKKSAVDAVRGLASYAAEQVVAMALTREGINLDDCWDRKVTAVNQTKGLTLTIDKKQDPIGGLEEVLSFADRLFAGPNPPRAILFIDEIEKSFGGLGSGGGAGDSSGVTQDTLGTTLKWMDGGGSKPRNVGLLAVGPPGTGKSLVAQNIARRAQVPMFTMDMGEMKGSLVGESEAAIREAYDVVSSVAGGGAVLVVATCNDLDILPPALRRRFSFGTWYFDLPTEEERREIWNIQIKSCNVDKKNSSTEGFDHTDWTGAEIRNCCDMAYRLNVPLKEAAKYVVPVIKADPKSIENLRKRAESGWLNASKIGGYKRPKKSTRRKMEVN